jgi:hypothetical protein
MRILVVLGVVTSALVAAAGGTAAVRQCGDCLISRYWAIDPDLWKRETLEKFPETDALEALRPTDLGVAFSGGGTRSAAATLGQLRGLRDSGWLEHVRYISAVSGGSWAALPFAYSPLTIDELLGAAELPGDLTLETLDDDTKARGKLGQAIDKSKILPGAAIEIGDRLSQSRLRGEFQKIAAAVFSRVKGPDAGRADKTFARLLDRIFIEPLVSKPLSLGSDAPLLFSWTDGSIAEMASVARAARGVARINPVSFARVTEDRPFVIALGTLVAKDAAGGFPRLIPVEYTPLYTGVRQQFGPAIGGTYVSPFAYDAQQALFVSADEGSNGRTGAIAIGPDGATSTFSLADVIASSGAAPQLSLLVDTLDARVDPALRQMATFFPHYRNVAVRVGATNTAGATEPMPHGDGGFVDNLGLLPLLARHVKNVIVFVNGKMGHRLETQLPSYFWPTGDPGGNGTRRINAVFETDRWQELMHGLDVALASGGPQIYCSDPRKPWKVLGNEYYNVQPYEGVNICWVYLALPEKPNGQPGAWQEALRPEVRLALFGDPKDKPKRVKGEYEKDFRRFPWFRTFGENVPTVVDMKARQINVMANLTSWMITTGDTQRKFVATFGMQPARR